MSGLPQEMGEKKKELEEKMKIEVKGVKRFTNRSLPQQHAADHC